MSLIQRIKSVLGLNGSSRVEDEGPVAVTVEHDPTTKLSEPDAEPVDPGDTSTPEHSGPVTEISGIGPSYSDRLAEAGITTVGELAVADAADIASQTDLSEKRVAGWIDSASELAGRN